MADAARAPAHMWFVKTGGEVWGPYPQERVLAFAREGRVRPTTMVSPFAAGPWTPAADAPEFAGGLDAAPLQTPDGPPPARARREQVDPPSGSAAPVTPLDAPHPPATPSGAERAVLIFAELTSVAPAAFEAALGRLGRCVPVKPGLWLLRAPTTAAALRNLLSSRLGAADALLVVEAPLDQAAWFNLAPAHDRELRRLWSGG